MCAWRIWPVLCVLGCVGASLCADDAEYDGDYEENYEENSDNEISQDGREADSQNSPCQTADFSRWEKVFIALEDAHMRQNMLLESVEKHCGGTVSLRRQMDQMAKGTCQQCLPGLVSACHRQTERAVLKLQHGLVELREEGEERARRLNATLQTLLRTIRGDGVRLGRPEGSGVRSFPSGVEEREVTSPLDAASLEKALVAVATELHGIHLRLSRAIEQTGSGKKARGDT